MELHENPWSVLLQEGPRIEANRCWPPEAEPRIIVGVPYPWPNMLLWENIIWAATPGRLCDRPFVPCEFRSFVDYPPTSRSVERVRTPPNPLVPSSSHPLPTHLNPANPGFKPTDLQDWSQLSQILIDRGTARFSGSPQVLWPCVPRSRKSLQIMTSMKIHENVWKSKENYES